MRSLASKPNTVAPGGDYPYGRTKDDDGSGNGTPVNEATHGDIHIFLEKLMDDGDVTPNDLPENVTNGFQLNLALAKVILNLTKKDTIQCFIDGGGATLGPGIKGPIYVGYNCVITGVVLLSDTASGSIVIDIWKDTYTNYAPTIADTIVAAAKPTITSAIKSKDTTLTGWSKTLTADDVLYFNIDSVTTKKWVNVILLVDRT